MGVQALCLLQESSGGSLAEKAVAAAEALKARTEEAAERARESLMGAAGTARVGGQLATGTSKGTVAAQQAQATAAEGGHTIEQTVAQDTERVTSLYREHQEAPQGPQQGAPQPSVQACTLALLCRSAICHDARSPFVCFGDQFSVYFPAAELTNKQTEVLIQVRTCSCAMSWPESASTTM